MSFTARSALVAAEEGMDRYNNDDCTSEGDAVVLLYVIANALLAIAHGLVKGDDW